MASSTSAGAGAVRGGAPKGIAPPPPPSIPPTASARTSAPPNNARAEGAIGGKIALPNRRANSRSDLAARRSIAPPDEAPTARARTRPAWTNASSRVAR